MIESPRRVKLRIRASHRGWRRAMQEAPPEVRSAAISAACTGAIQSVEVGKGSAPRGLLFTPRTTATWLRHNSRCCKTHGEPPGGQKSTRFADGGQMARSTPRRTCAWPHCLRVWRMMLRKSASADSVRMDAGRIKRCRLQRVPRQAGRRCCCPRPSRPIHVLASARAGCCGPAPGCAGARAPAFTSNSRGSNGLPGGPCGLREGSRPCRLRATRTGYACQSVACAYTARAV